VLLGLRSWANPVDVVGSRFAWLIGRRNDIAAHEANALVGIAHCESMLASEAAGWLFIQENGVSDLDSHSDLD
jgi:hypothetical protein